MREIITLELNLAWLLMCTSVEEWELCHIIKYVLRWFVFERIRTIVHGGQN